MRRTTIGLLFTLLGSSVFGACRFWSVRPIIEDVAQDVSIDQDALTVDARDDRSLDAEDDQRQDVAQDASARCSVNNGSCGDPRLFECIEGTPIRCALRCEVDRSVLLQGVGRIDTRTFLFSPLIVHGDHACPLLVTAAGRPFAAFARVGRGRVVWLAHDAALTTLAMQADGAALLRNVLAWGVDRATLSGVRVGLEPAANLGTVATIVVREGGAPRTVSAGEVRIGELDAWVTASTQAPTAEAERAAVRTFVEQGGLLVLGGQAWNWARNNPTQSVAQYPGNGLIPDAGIFVVGSSIAATETAVGATIMPTELSHARRALDRVLQHVSGARALAMAEQTVAAFTLADPVAELPLDTAFWAAARGLLAPPLPSATRDRPLVVLAQPIDAARLHALVRVNRHGPESWIERASLADDFPGALTASAERIELRIDGGAPITEARFQYSQSSASVWRSTGAYARPGERVSIEIPESATTLGLEAQIGAHDRSLTLEPQWQRAPLLNRVVALDRPRVSTASAFGGLVFIRVAPGRAPTTVDVTIEGAARAPSFSRGQRVDEWRAQVAASLVPWGELVGHHVILTLPLATLRSVVDPVALLDHWDAVLSTMADLAGLDIAMIRPERVVLDRQLQSGLVADSGYPAVRQIDRAALLTDLATLLRDGEWGTYYILGRRFQARDWTIPGSQDALPALFSLYAYDRILGRSIADVPHAPLAPASRSARLEAYIAAGRNYVRDFNGNTALEMYLQLIEGFGWAPMRALLHEYQSLADAERPTTDDARVQQWALRSSRVFGRDLSPFYQRWGLPLSPATRMATAAYPPWAEAPARP